MIDIAYPTILLAAAAIPVISAAWAAGADRGTDAPATPPTPPPTRDGWTLTWHDEFDGPAIDTAKWEVLTRRDCPNQELQTYLPQQASIVDGKLRITAIDEPHEGKPYRSGRLEGRITQAHGRFECRAKLPRTQGMWPAFWLLPSPPDWPRRGEIDVMESKGRNTRWTSSAFHFLDPATKKHRYVTQAYEPRDAKGQLIDLADDFHVYAVEWELGELRFYLDDAAEPYWRVTKADAPLSDEPMRVILNLAVGGWFDGNPDKSTVFPQHFDVDYVRAWKKNR